LLDEQVAVLSGVYLAVGAAAGTDLLTESTRSMQKRDLLSDLLTAWLEDEGVARFDMSAILDTTVNNVATIAIDAVETGKSNAQVVSILQDHYSFSPARANTIARTTVGTAQSIGQIVQAEAVGVTHKRWNDSGFEVRDIHRKRDNEVVAIGQKFSLQAGDVAPRYPLDHLISGDDRINCRCFMTFEIN